MRYLTNTEQRVNKRGIWQHGKRGGYAICPLCSTKIERGSWVKAAPGKAGTIRHVTCPTWRR